MPYSLETLEFDKLLELIAWGSETALGRERILAIRPFTDRAELDRVLTVLDEALTLDIESRLPWSFSGLQDPSDAVATLAIRNAVLEPLTMLDLAAVCEGVLTARSRASGPERRGPRTLVHGRAGAADSR